MSLRILAIVAILALAAAASVRAQQAKETTMNPTHIQGVPRTRARAAITVTHSESSPLDESGGPALSQVRLEETFTGDIEGESTVRALQVQGSDRSARLVSMQRFRGSLGGRRGTFVLQGSETVERGAIKATWFVLPGSGTEGLSGLRGEGGFEGAFGKGSAGTLDYWFE